MKQEANATILDLNETTTRCIANKYEPKNKEKILEKKKNIEKEQKEENKRATKEHIAQTAQSTNRSEKNKEQGISNNKKARGGREQERVSQISYAMNVDQKNIKM